MSVENADIELRVATKRKFGIDVRWYAQRSQNIIRASCACCGMCAAVCPRGVLSLEYGPPPGRTNEALSSPGCS